MTREAKQHRALHTWVVESGRLGVASGMLGYSYKLGASPVSSCAMD